MSGSLIVKRGWVWFWIKILAGFWFFDGDGEMLNFKR